MKILVTGNKGYIGALMVPMLKKEGHQITGLDTNFFEGCNFQEEKISTPEIQKDLRDINISDLKGYEAIIHLAALSNDPLSNLNPKITYDINYEATVNLAETAKKAEVSRFVLSSTCSVYGSSGEHIITEGSEPNPITPYAESKVMSEQEITKMCDTNFTPTFLRSATAYGVSPKLRADLVLNNLVGWAYTTGTVLLKSDGMSWRPIAHIEDISNAFQATLKEPREKISKEIFNVGRKNENYRIKELAEIVADTVPDSRVSFAEGAGPDKRSYRVDFTKIQKTLTYYKPKWTARKGALELYKAYKSVNLTQEELESNKYIRLKHLKKLMNTGKLDQELRWIRDQ
jgi:nucleoside-diphosphate-sugar epimerase